MVRAHIATLRGTPSVAPPRPPTVRQVTGWLTRCPELNTAAGHVRDLGEVRTGPLGVTLPAWIDAADAGHLPGLTGFAVHLLRDLDAVTADLTLDWSSGSIEGAVNRIKKIARTAGTPAAAPPGTSWRSLLEAARSEHERVDTAVAALRRGRIRGDCSRGSAAADQGGHRRSGQRLLPARRDHEDSCVLGKARSRAGGHGGSPGRPRRVNLRAAGGTPPPRLLTLNAWCRHGGWCRRPVPVRQPSRTSGRYWSWRRPRRTAVIRSSGSTKARLAVVVRRRTDQVPSTGLRSGA